jgi:hypothetical protein
MEEHGISFLFGLIGVLGTIFTIYGLYRKKRKRIKLTILSSTSLFKHNDDIPDLKFFYKEKDLSQSKEVLKIATVRIENYGEKEII